MKEFQRREERRGMRLLKLIKTDLRLGLCRKWRYLAAALVFLLPLAQFWSWKQYYAETSSELLSWSDGMACVFMGIYPHSGVGQMDDFAVPPVWFVMLLFFFLLSLDYPSRTMELWGEQYTIRCGKIRWWISKYIYVFCCVAKAFAILVLEMLLLCAVSGLKVSMHNCCGFYKYLFAEANLNFTEGFKAGENFLLLILLPFLGILAISEIQLFLSVWVRPVFAYIISAILLVFSSYYEQPFLLGNYIMLIRSRLICVEGIPLAQGISICLGTCMAVFVVGCILIRKKELLRFKKEEA